MIARTVSRATTEPTQLLIDIATPEGKASGLLHTSAVKCEHLITLHRSLVQRSIGRLPGAAMQRINDCLKAALEFPESASLSLGAGSDTARVVAKQSLVAVVEASPTNAWHDKLPA